MNADQSGGWLVWVRGSSTNAASGFASELQSRLRQFGTPSCLLDGDGLRGALHPSPGETVDAHEAFYETLVDLAVMLARQTLIVIVAVADEASWVMERARAAAPRFLDVVVARARPELSSVISAHGPNDEEALHVTLSRLGCV